MITFIHMIIFLSIFLFIWLFVYLNRVKAIRYEIQVRDDGRKYPVIIARRFFKEYKIHSTYYIDCDMWRYGIVNGKGGYFNWVTSFEMYLDVTKRLTAEWVGASLSKINIHNVSNFTELSFNEQKSLVKLEAEKRIDVTQIKSNAEALSIYQLMICYRTLFEGDDTDICAKAKILRGSIYESLIEESIMDKALK